MDSSKLREMLVTGCGLNPDQRILLGFSGGPDSLSLLHLALEAGFQVIAAHLDHALRSSSSAESDQLRSMCANFGLKYIQHRIDVTEYAAARKISIEEAARIVRYQFLFETANGEGAQAVLVGHNADDQVETVMMHLLRGSGLNGLRGMKAYLLPNPWSNTIPLIRPLLETRRSEIEVYCQEHGLEPIRDETNEDTLIFRNRIRHELIPNLETYNVNFRQNLLKTAAILQAEDDFLEGEVQAARQLVTSTVGKEYVVFKRKGFLQLQCSIQRRLIRSWIQEIASTLRDVEFEMVERARNFVLSGNSSNYLQLVNGLEMFAQRHEEIVLGLGDYAELWPQIPQGTRLPVSVPMALRIDEFHLFSCNRTEQKEPGRTPWSVRIDSERFRGTLHLRTANAGDRFKPFGLDGKSLKLGDFWTNEGLPVKARSQWPLLCDDKEIIWVPGFRIADSYQITPETQGVIEVQIFHSKPGKE